MISLRDGLCAAICSHPMSSFFVCPDIIITQRVSCSNPSPTQRILRACGIHISVLLLWKSSFGTAFLFICIFLICCERGMLPSVPHDEQSRRFWNDGGYAKEELEAKRDRISRLRRPRLDDVFWIAASSMLTILPTWLCFFQQDEEYRQVQAPKADVA